MTDRPQSGKIMIEAGEPGGRARHEALLNCPTHGNPYTELREELDTALIESDQPMGFLDRAEALSTLMEIVERMAEVVTAHRVECDNQVGRETR